MIHIPYWWHATLFEILWLVGGLIGGAITVENVRDSRKDGEMVDELAGDQSIHRRHWQMIAIAQHDREESQWSRLAICSLIVASGTIGVIQPNPLGGVTTWTGVIVTITLLGVAALTGFRSWRDYQNRKRLYGLALGRTDVIAAKLRIKAKHDDAA